MLKRLIFLLTKKRKYNNFHKKYFFSQNEVSKILHKVRYNSPEVLEQNPNLELVKNTGIETSKQIYVEEAKKINFFYAKNLYLAEKICSFSLVIFYDEVSEILALKKFLKFAIFLDKKTTSKPLKENLFLLNINKNGLSIFDIKEEEKIEILGGQILTKNFKNYCLNSTINFGSNELQIKEYFYNGKFYFINNLLKNNKKLIILIKKIIKINYFNNILIKKNKKGFILFDYVNNKKFYFLTNIFIKTISLTKIKNSKNQQFFAKLNSQNISKIAIYFGEEKVNILDEDLEQKVITEKQKIFNFKIKSENRKIDFFVNFFLPNLIQKNEVLLGKNLCKKSDVKLKSISQILFFYKHKKICASRAYFAIKNLLFYCHKNFIVFNECDLESYELKINFGGEEKTFKIKKSKQKKLIVGGFEYLNCNSISFDVISKHNSFEVFV